MKTVRNLVLILSVSIVAITAYGQNNVGIGTSVPDRSAILDLSSGDKGFLVPRIADTSLIATPWADGLVFYNTTQQCLFVYRTGQGWLNLCHGGVTGAT